MPSKANEHQRLPVSQRIRGTVDCSKGFSDIVLILLGILFLMSQLCTLTVISHGRKMVAGVLGIISISVLSRERQDLLSQHSK
jgi:hypothetical protein